MTDAMRTLFDYILSERYSAFLTRQDYQLTETLFGKLQTSLEEELPAREYRQVEKLLDALMERQAIELEAMFQATWLVSGELR